MALTIRNSASVLKLAFYSLIVGAAFPLSKIALNEGIAPTTYVFWQCFGAGWVCLVYAVLKGRYAGINAKAILFCVLVGFLGLALPNSIMIYSLQAIPAGTMGLVISTLPLLTVVFCISLRLEFANKWMLIGVLMGVLGVAMLFVPVMTLPSGPIGIVRLLLAFVSPALYALSGLLIARYFPTEVSTAAVTGCMLISASLFLLPYTVFLVQAPVGFDLVSLLGLLIVIQILISSLSYALYFEIINHSGAIFMSQAAYLVPFSATLWSMLLINEHVTLTFLAAASCILAGVFCVMKGRALNITLA